jgi:3-oxo-5alpha-steroid 4-dehydrogenase
MTNDANEVIGVKVLSLRDGVFSKALHALIDKAHHLLYYGALFWPPFFSLLAILAESLEKKFGKVQHIRARKGVVLATGGFYANQPMIKQYAPAYAGGSPLGTMCDDGSGILLAQALGAKLKKMDAVSAWRFINPPESFVKGVLVGLNGERVCNEMLYGAQVGEHIMKKHNGKAWLILDVATYKASLKDLNFEKALWFQIAMGLFFRHLGSKKANSIDELASKAGINAQQLRQTLQQYNDMARSTEADPLGKPKACVAPLEQGPFYAINVSYDYFYSPCPSLTFGGLEVNEQSGLVKHQNGGDIKGLYAAGRTAVGIPANGYVSGLSIADCVFSGRRAARYASNA